MEFRVTSKPVLIVGLCVFSVLGLSGLGFSRSVDWDENALQGATFAQVFGPQLPEIASSDQTLAPTPKTRNLDIAEAQFSYVRGFDVSNIGTSSDQTSARNIEKTEIEDTVLRLAYAQYLVSLLAAEDVLGVDPSAGQADAPIRQIELATSNSISLQAEEAVDIDNVDSITQPEQILPTFLYVDPPIPHIRGQLGAVASAQNIEKFVSVPVENLFPTPQNAPIPAPVALRPVMAVHPESVLVVQPARDVSLDRLVHVQAQGSWPRRLDQINTVGNDNIFMQDWGRNGPKNETRLRRLPNGFVLVTANK